MGRPSRTERFRPRRPDQATETQRNLARRQECRTWSPATEALVGSPAMFDRFLKEQIDRVERTTDRALRRVQHARWQAGKRAVAESGDRKPDLIVHARGTCCGSDAHVPNDDTRPLL